MGFKLKNMFKKNMMKNAYSPKISILLQFGVETLVLNIMVCSEDSIQILLILPQFQMFGTEAKLEGFVWCNQSMTVPISHPKSQ